MIFKAQRPLATNGSYRTVLVYNEDRSVQVELDNVPDDVIEQIFGQDEYRVFIEGNINAEGNIVVDEVISEQGW